MTVAQGPHEARSLRCCGNSQAFGAPPRGSGSIASSRAAQSGKRRAGAMRPTASSAAATGRAQRTLLLSCGGSRAVAGARRILTHNLETP